MVSHDGAYTSFILECSKGCYVRSIATDIATKFGTCCYVSELRRTKIGKFSVNDSSNKIIPIIEFLNDFKIISVTDEIARKVMNGQATMELSQMNNPSEFIIENKNSNLIAFCDFSDNSLRIKRIS
jgi:tRNA pseudouridine55 synthase